MITSSRRVRAEEKRLVRKVVITISVVAAAIIFTLYFGLPMLARVLLFGVHSSPTDNQAVSTTLFAPVFDPIPEATNTATINLSGYAQKDTQVQLVINDKDDDRLHVDDQGKFFAEKVDIKDGDNTIAAYTVKGDAKSSPSEPTHIRSIKSQPKLDISSPGDGDKFSGDQRTITIKGTTDPGNRVTVNDRLAIMDQHGGFTLTFPLPDGDTTLKITAQDPAGNQTTTERKVSYSS